MRYIIIGSGSIENDDLLTQVLARADRIVCADGGTGYLAEKEIIPDMVIGDFDSIKDNALAFIQKNRIPVLKYPVKKDASDTELAVLWAMENRASEIIMMGTTGTRLDHTLANLFLMKKIALRGIRCRTIDDHNEIFPVLDTLTLKGKPGELLSIIPAGEKVEGVTLTGVEYPLENAEISMGSSLGISNCFIRETAVIKIKKGFLLVTKSRD
ncbi:MAG: thiamine diphosphokinase [Thermodesulfobacteriota bacterium]|nr:thiamine diphosphokinase [Thermodesulfobacteriota bacterium]